MREPRVLQSLVWNVYFQNMYDEKRKKGAPIHCVVIADNVEEALALVKSSYPNEPVDHISKEREYSYSSALPVERRRDTIILRG